MLFKEGMTEYWVTNQGEYVQGGRMSVASLDMLKCLSEHQDKLGPFVGGHTPELRWTGILKTLKSHL
ncbi:hypothetical protein SAMN05428965_0302 [Geodermatophilus sp. DSM 45219]|nr:hypothetical protein SAMN05428965_0302 [Geodermatophilus sp. DSM 45219]